MIVKVKTIVGFQRNGGEEEARLHDKFAREQNLTEWDKVLSPTDVSYIRTETLLIGDEYDDE